MENKTILISGGAGFIGSHIVELLSTHNYKVIVLKRANSNLSRLNEVINDNIIVVDISNSNYIQEIKILNPCVFIHSAWQGVESYDRENWKVQLSNVNLILEMLLLVDSVKIKKVIAFGSQSEYGNFDGRINEDADCKPVTAYGAAKVASQIVLKSFCDVHQINWLWLRVFSLYGERENLGWLIPSVIKKIMTQNDVDLTYCDQKYDYMYAKEFASAIMQVLSTHSESGIFNLSSNSSIKLKEIIEKIKLLINPTAKLNYGAIPYRKNQIMHMEGDSTKFYKTFKFNLHSNMDMNLNEVINYYKMKITSSNESI